MDDDKGPLKRIEGAMESALFASRWLLAPFYLGLALSLVVLLIKFLAELAHIGSPSAKLLMNHRDEICDGGWDGLGLS